MHRILIALTFCFAAMAFAGSGLAQVSRTEVLPKSSETVESELKERLIELNRQLWEEYMLRHNTEPYQRAALPEYLFLANIGLVETKDEVIATVGNLQVDAVRVANEEFRLHENTAILIGKLEVRGRVLGHPLPPQMRYMSVFVKSSGEWRVLAQSLTEVVNPRDLQRKDK